MRKKRFFLQFENTNGLSKKNPYLNSSVCLLVFIVVSGAIESDSVEFQFHCSLCIYPSPRWVNSADKLLESTEGKQP